MMTALHPLDVWLQSRAVKYTHILHDIDIDHCPRSPSGLRWWPQPLQFDAAFDGFNNSFSMD